MKNNKSLITYLLSIALIAVILVGELVYCAQRTLLSPSHFSSMLENKNKLTQLTALVYDGLSNPVEKTDTLPTINIHILNILRRTDQDWLKGQIYIGATGLQKYLTEDATTLPTFDFVPINTVIKEYLISEVMSQPQAKERIQKIKTVLTVLSNKYLSAIINFGLNNQITSMLLELAPIRSTGFDRNTLQEIVRIYLSYSNKATTIDQASKDIAAQMASDALELNRLKDYFDLNLFLEKAFGDNNPIASFKTMINKIYTSISITNNIIFFCMLLLLLISVRFSFLRLLRAIVFCAIIASVLNLLLSVLFISPNITKEFVLSLSSSNNAFKQFLNNVLVFLLKDFGLYLALQSVLAAIALSILHFILKLASPKDIKAKPLKNTFAALRFSAVLLIIILVSFWFNLYSINSAETDFRRTLQKLVEKDIYKGMQAGMSEAGGMHFLKHLQKK